MIDCKIPDDFDLVLVSIGRDCRPSMVKESQLLFPVKEVQKESNNSYLTKMYTDLKTVSDIRSWNVVDVIDVERHCLFTQQRITSNNTDLFRGRIRPAVNPRLMTPADRVIMHVTTTIKQ